MRKVAEKRFRYLVSWIKWRIPALKKSSFFPDVRNKFVAWRRSWRDPSHDDRKKTAKISEPDFILFGLNNQNLFFCFNRLALFKLLGLNFPTIGRIFSSRKFRGPSNSNYLGQFLILINKLSNLACKQREWFTSWVMISQIWRKKKSKPSNNPTLLGSLFHHRVAWQICRLLMVWLTTGNFMQPLSMFLHSSVNLSGA